MIQSRSPGQTGNLGPAAQRPVVEVNQRGNVNVPGGKDALGIELRQGFATATLVLV